MEIGCGQGALALLLASRFDYRGYEPDTASWQVAQARLSRRGLRQVLNRSLPDSADRTFDVVGAFEVLEHQPDDRAALTSWIRWVRPGGHLLLSVPAHPDRFGAADRYVGHFRRYSRTGLFDVLRSAGFDDIRIVTYGFPLGYLLEGVRNVIMGQRESRGPGAIEDRTMASGRRLQPGDQWALAIWAATAPFALAQRPFGEGNLGIGFVAHARRPDVRA
jgi:SAM-dependent methyltransferase